MSIPEPDPALREDIEALRADLSSAVYADSRFGHENFAAFPPLIARADEIGDEYWQFHVRVEAVYAASWEGTSTDVLTLCVWLLRYVDRQGPGFVWPDWAANLFQTTLAEFVQDVALVPEISLAAAEGIVADWERRVAGTPYESAAAAAVARARFAQHRGDRAGALALLDACDDFAPPQGTCEEGARAIVAQLYTDLGRPERAIELSEPDLVDDGNRCGFFPAETHTALIGAWARLGRRAEVIQAAASIGRVYDEFPRLDNVASAVIALLRVDALDEAFPLAVGRIAHLDQQQNPYREALECAALAAVFASRADTDPGLTLSWRTEASAPARPRPIGEIATELADRARQLARRYDVRNASTVISDQIEEILALRAASVPADGVVPVPQRTATELLSGAAAYQTASPRRARECAAALAARLGELGGTDRARARRLIAWNLRLDDPVAAQREARVLSEELRDEFPAWAAMSALIADAMAVEDGDADPQIFVDRGRDLDEASWPRIPRAGYLRNLAASQAPRDPGRALHLLDEALLALAGDGPVGYPDTDDGGSADSDLAATESGLQYFRAHLLTATGADPAGALDAALLSARRAVATAATADQALSARADAVEALRAAAGHQAQTDPGAALVLLDEAVELAVHEQLAETLGQRMATRSAHDDYDGALADAEQAAAVWTVEGFDYPADGLSLEVARLKLTRRDDPRPVIDLVRPIRDRMAERGDHETAEFATSLLGRAQAAAGLAEAAASSFTELIDGLTGEEAPGYRAQLREARGQELWSLERMAEAHADFAAAAQGYLAADDPYSAADALRTAALTAHYSGDQPAALSALDQAGDLYDRLSAQGSVGFERGRLQLVRADIVQRDDPAESKALLDDLAGQARAAGWTPLLTAALYTSARQAVDEGDDATARRCVAEGLRVDPEHPGLTDLDEYLTDPD